MTCTFTTRRLHDHTRISTPYVLDRTLITFFIAYQTEKQIRGEELIDLHNHKAQTLQYTSGTAPKRSGTASSAHLEGSQITPFQCSRKLSAHCFQRPFQGCLSRQFVNRGFILLRQASATKGILFHIGSTVNNTNNVVALGEEGNPVVQSLLLLVVQVVPLRFDILGLS